MTKKKEANLHGLIANLIEELIDMGYNEKDLVWMLNQYGITEEETKEWYGIPYDKK